MATAEERKAALAAKRAAKSGAVIVAPPSDDTERPQPELVEVNTLSLFRKAATLGTPATLVLGNATSGKSTVVRDVLLAEGRRPLWLALSNSAVLNDERCSDWTVGSVPDWATFIKGVHQPIMRGEVTDFDVIVIDGLDVLANLCVLHEAPSGQAERQDWLKASNKLYGVLAQLREKANEFYATVSVVNDLKSTTGGRKIALNPYAKDILLSLFGNKWYTHVTKERGEDKRLTGNLIYTLQTQPLLALDFVPGEPVPLT